MQKIVDQLEHTLELVKKPIYMGSLGILHVLYALLFFGIIDYSAMIVERINIFIQVFICLFLIIRFHPFRSHELKEFDAQIIFGSAAFLLTNLGLAQYFTYYFDQTKTIVSKMQERIVSQNL